MTRFTICLLLSVLAGAVPFDAQQIGQNAPAGEGPSTFSTSSQLVIETVNVKDKSGKPVVGLTAKDFTVTEDGAEQAIRFFEYQKMPETVEVALPSATLPQPLKKLPEAQITSEKPGDIAKASSPGGAGRSSAWRPIRPGHTVPQYFPGQNPCPPGISGRIQP